MFFEYSGYNGVIKKIVTFRERMPLGPFTAKILEMTQDLSNDYKEGKREIRAEPFIPTALWREAALLAKNVTFPCVRAHASDVDTSYYMPSNKWLKGSSDFNLKNIKDLQRMKWKSFDQYVELGYGMYWSVTLSNDDWKSCSQCDCPNALKEFICKHIIAIALRMKKAKLPRTAISTVLEPNRPSGRKKKAAKALIVQ